MLVTRFALFVILKEKYTFPNFHIVSRKCENEILILTLTLIMAFKLSSAQPMEHKKYSAGILSRKHFTQGNKI
jgi:hypothetical protein